MRAPAENSETHAAEVLILVIVEYALWVIKGDQETITDLCLNPCYSGICSVSGRFSNLPLDWHCVLILVIVEYALWDSSSISGPLRPWSLNPCYSGICSVSTMTLTHIALFRSCLNPCYSGICSVRVMEKKKQTPPRSLNPCYSGICSVSRGENQDVAGAPWGLNPCYSGICSVSLKSIGGKRIYKMS